MPNPNNQQTSCLQIKITGKVQGVWFRASTREKARELGIGGTVKNLPDGSVLIEAEGDEKDMQKFIAWCHEGPPHAQVHHVEILEINPQGFKNFKIVRGLFL